jgi:hypothetical protein
MESAWNNRLLLITKCEKFIDALNDLNMQGELENFYYSSDILREKMEKFQIPLNFNFDVWNKVKSCCDVFNYLKMSKRTKLKLKWMEVLIRKFPDILCIYYETHYVYEKFKILLNELMADDVEGYIPEDDS